MEKYAFITGGTKGIGKAVATLLAHSGYNLILSYANDFSGAEAFCASLKKETKKDIRIIQADISNPETIQTLSGYFEENSIQLDAVIFNAGLTCREPFETMDPKEWEKVFYANVHFPVFLLQEIINRISKGGSVVFTGSLMGIQPHSVSLAYGVSKSAVHALVKNLVKFTAPYQIRVNGVAPGFVDTEWQKNKPAEIRKNIENKVAAGRFCKPEEVADVYKMLIENNYFNGEVVVIDGGYSYR